MLIQVKLLLNFWYLRIKTVKQGLKSGICRIGNQSAIPLFRVSGRINNKPFITMRLLDRLYQYLEINEISVYAFEHSCGLSNGYMGKQFAGKGTVGSSVLEKIKNSYPDLDIHWLVTGNGNMTNMPDELIRSYNKQIQQLEQMLADKETIIDLLQQSERWSGMQKKASRIREAFNPGYALCIGWNRFTGTDQVSVAMCIVYPGNTWPEFILWYIV